MAVGVVVIAAATALSGVVTASGANQNAVLIRYTEYGIPHVLASDWAGVGEGVGYAQAHDHLCLIAETMVTTSAQRSRYFGPQSPPPGATPIVAAATNLTSDLYVRAINDARDIERLVAQPAPMGPTAEFRALVSGYVDGYNRYLREREITDPTCRDAAWVRPMRPIDVYRRLYHLGLLAGQGSAVDGIVAARPPIGGQDDPQPSGTYQIDELRSAASNAIAMGGDATATGRGAVLSNTHLGFTGDLRLWQAQLTIPGRLDVSGAMLVGLPFVLFGGHNETMSWATTVSAAAPFTLMEVTLPPGDPTSYLVDGRPVAMTRRTVTVDAGATSVTRDQYWTSWGPVITSLRGLSLPWTVQRAFVLADANTANLRWGNQMLDVARTGTAPAVLDAVARHQGSGFINILAADADGMAAYGQLHVVPHVTDNHAARCSTTLGQQTYPTGLVILDASRSSCAWGSDPDAVQPGTFGASRLPQLIRRDYVANSNDSYWLTNPDQPLTGYPRILGPAPTPLSLRTRMGLVSIADQLDTGAFTAQGLRDLLTSHRLMAAQLAQADTITLCAALPGGVATGSTGPVDVSAACDVLATWDGRATTTSRGALLFSRYWLAALRNTSNNPWTVPFDPGDPIHTPHGLATNHPGVQRALADAVTELRAAGIPLDAPLGDHQYLDRAGQRFPLPGAHTRLGAYHRLDGIWNPTTGGYTSFGIGPTYVHTVAFTGTPCPEVATVLAYSQSSDPTSPHHTDQTRLYSTDQWVTNRYCEHDITTSPALRTISLPTKARHGRPGGGPAAPGRATTTAVINW